MSFAVSAASGLEIIKLLAKLYSPGRVTNLWWHSNSAIKRSLKIRITVYERARRGGCFFRVNNELIIRQDRGDSTFV